MISIDREKTLLAHMKKGINLFTGAGFSILPDSNGMSLPTGTEYARELVKEFKTNYKGDNLDRVANILPPEALQKYTRKRFTVSEINALYKQINKLNLKSFITTNYDNIPKLIFEDNKEFKLYDVRSGNQSSTPRSIPFIPIHGDVLNPYHEIIIGSIKVVMQTRDTSHSLNLAKKYVDEYPTLVWGYNLADSTAIQIFEETFRNKKGKVWILCRECDNDEDQINYYRDLGCNVITGDTQELLQWIGENLQEILPKDGSYKNKLSSKYGVPKEAKNVPTAEIGDYFKNGYTTWYHILKNMPYERKCVDSIVESSLNTNVIITGQKFSGKTTILMQVALKSPCNKYYFEDLTETVADLIISNLGEENIWLFIDNCSNLKILKKLATHKNIHIVAAAHELLYESEKNFLNEVEHTEYNITELLDKNEAEEIFEKVPVDYRLNQELIYKDDEDEKYSMIEFITKNIEGTLSNNLVSKILKSINNQDKTAIETIALAVYLSERHSALTTDVMMAYFNLNNYEDVIKITNRVNSLLRNISDCISFEQDEEEQDYFRMRSGLFLVRASKLFERNESPAELREVYKSMIKRFVEYVSPLRIWRYEDFQRREYDAELFYNLFTPEEADELYNTLYYYSRNPFVLQQWALFHRRCGDYRRAFDEITKVKGMHPNNLSIKNSYAMILFEMNDTEGGEDAIIRMRKAMDIFEKLHEKDTRKKYHTEKYSDYAIVMYEKYGIDAYLKNALRWLKDIKEDNYKIKTNLKKIELLISENEQ